MSTSSSSDCNCLFSPRDVNYNCDANYNCDVNYNHDTSYNYDPSYNYRAVTTPFYPTMCQPLIYYARLTNGPGRKRKSRRGNPNCFVKAFRWYTQERCGNGKQTVGVSNSTRMDPDIANFATWLDGKYEEFVRDGRLDQSCCRDTTQSFITNDGGIQSEGYCEPCAPPCAKKKDVKQRSPWKCRRRSSANKKDSGDRSEKTNKSLEYIMAPKDLHHPASDSHNHQTPTPCCSESQGSKKITVKSLSMASICQNIEMHTVDVVTTQDGDKIRQTLTKTTPSITTPSKESAAAAKIKKQPKNVSSRRSKHDFSCQCATSVVNMQSQYDSKSVEPVCKKASDPATAQTVTKEIETTNVAASPKPTSLATTKQQSSPCCECSKLLPKYQAQLCLNCNCPTYNEDGTVCYDSKLCPTKESSRQQDVTTSKPIIQEPLVSGLNPEVETETFSRLNYLQRESIELLNDKCLCTLKSSFHFLSKSATAQTSDHSIDLFYKRRRNKKMDHLIIISIFLKVEYLERRLGFHPYVVDLPAIRTKKFASSFIMRTAKEWNALPADLFPEQYNLGLFKARVNRHFSREEALIAIRSL